MPGWEVIGEEERIAIHQIFTQSNGVFYRYGFDELRNHIFRVDDFERQLADKIGVGYAHATSSGTSALIASLLALDVGKGDEVITQSHTFIATVEAIVATGATPVIADVDKSLNIDPNSLESLITKKTKCIIPVHMSGTACDMGEILRILDENYDKGHKIKILEDNAQSLGGTYKGKYLGTIGDMGILSFDPGKVITTGEGGMIITDNEELYKKVRAISDHGHAYKPNIPRGEDTAMSIGYNFKMNELQGAIGLEQLKKMDSIIDAHKKNKQKLMEKIKDIGLEFRKIHNPEGDVGACLTFFLPSKEEATNFVEQWHFGTHNLPDARRWHDANYWKHIDFKSNGLEQSQKLLERTISIPISVNMGNEEIENMAKAIKEVIK